MFGLFKKNTSEDKPKAGLLTSLSAKLKKTRANLTSGLATLFLGKKAIDADLLESLETCLLTADVGVKTTQTIIDNLTAAVSRKQLADSEALYAALKAQLLAILQPASQPLVIPPQERPFVILMVGVNGNGKTTTIGKLTHYLQQQNKKVLLAAGDTYRAAAIEQLQAWGERNHTNVISQHAHADSASVIFDALQAATARQADVLIADTAGRLHTQHHLMAELKKIRRVLTKIDPTAPHEVMLVLDASTGQNAVRQAEEFHREIGVTGITLTKLDGTAKGGVIFSIAQTFGLPIRFIGVGEGMDDLQPFNAEDFVDALFSDE